MFARSLDGDSTRLVEAIDEFVAEHEAQKARAFVVFVAKQEDLERQVQEFARDREVKIPLTFPADGPDGDGLKPYKLNMEVPLTVLLADKRTVVKAFSIEKLSDETIEVLESAFAGMLDSGA